MGRASSPDSPTRAIASRVRARSAASIRPNSPKRREEPGKTLQQRGFSGAVRPADSQRRAGDNFAIEMMNGGMAVVTERQVDQADRSGQCSAQ